MLVEKSFFQALDKDNDGKLTLDEVTAGFAQWHSAWDKAHSSVLTEAQLRDGINSTFASFGGGPPGFGPPPGMAGPDEMEMEERAFEMP
jgi:hypothetical protein